MNTKLQAKQFTSLDELLDYCWARSFEYAQVAHLAQVNGVAMTNGDFFEGYSKREQQMQEYFRAEAAKKDPANQDILNEHW